MTVEQRYWVKVQRGDPDECWPWLAFRNPLGYGMFRSGTEQLAHRFAYVLASGEIIPSGLSVCHACDSPGCQNPRHLFLGSHRDNMQDMAAKGRAGVTHQIGESNGMARLTRTQVADIRARYAAGATQEALAKAFGISQSQISRVARAQTWPGAAPIDGSRRRAKRDSGKHPHAKLTDEQVGTIMARYLAGGVSQQALGDEYGVSQATISWLVRQSRTAPRVS